MEIFNGFAKLIGTLKGLALVGLVGVTFWRALISFHEEKKMGPIFSQLIIATILIVACEDIISIVDEICGLVAKGINGAI